MSIQITITGNLTDDPELRFTNSGTSVASLTLISEDRYRDNETGEWNSRNRTVVRVTAWRQLAEHVANGYRKGDRIKVEGRRVEARGYINRDGEAAASLELTADEVDDRRRTRYGDSAE